MLSMGRVGAFYRLKTKSVHRDSSFGSILGLDVLGFQ